MKPMLCLQKKRGKSRPDCYLLTIPGVTVAHTATTEKSRLVFVVGLNSYAIQPMGVGPLLPSTMCGNDCMNCRLWSPDSVPWPPPVATLPAGQSTLDLITFPGGTVTNGPSFVTTTTDG